MKNNVKPKYEGNLRRVEEIAEGLEAKADAILGNAKEFAFTMILEGDMELTEENRMKVKDWSNRASCIMEVAESIRELLNREDKQDSKMKLIS